MGWLEEVPACHEWAPPAGRRPGERPLGAIAAWQDGRCAVCGLRRALVVDHHHASGLVRGLLCAACNTAEGRRTSLYDRPYGTYRQRPPALILGATEVYAGRRRDAYYYELGEPPDDPVLAARVLAHLIRHPPRRPGRPVGIPGLPGSYVVGDGMRRLAARLAAGEGDARPYH
ncbi:endonuclease domain-containing protein [Streptomyces polyrhachis]|uniref:Endonuclease domain-containing protein n=1 Tax=Streptomyces polyrhachis TaxID=1282885 RepID=A0ABW2G9R3_9ACTN